MNANLTNTTSNTTSPYSNNPYLNSWWLAPLSSIAIFFVGVLLFLLGRCIRDACCNHYYNRANFEQNNVDYISYPGEASPMSASGRLQQHASSLDHQNLYGDQSMTVFSPPRSVAAPAQKNESAGGADGGDGGATVKESHQRIEEM